MTANKSEQKISLASIPDVSYITEMLQVLSDLLDGLNEVDDVVKEALPENVKYILNKMNQKKYQSLLASLRVSLKRWERGYGKELWEKINKIIDECDESLIKP